MTPTRTLRSLAITIAATITATASAQPVVPKGFTARLIAPLDGQIPQLSAIDDPEFGRGVVAATASNGVVNVRLVEPTGVIRSLGVWPDAPESPQVLRTRFDSNSIVGELIVVTIRDLPTSGTSLVSIDSNGDVVEQAFQSGSVGFDFDFTQGTSGNPVGAVLLDITSIGGTALASMNTMFDVVIENTNSVPPNRTDTDVMGFQRDVTGVYGGGVLLADTDDTDFKSAVYELRDVLSGGNYRAIYGPVDWSERRYGDLAIAANGDFGGVIYVTETLTNEIQQVATDGTHTTWATGFVGIDSLSITPAGDSMYVGDLNGVWLIRASGDEPGPVVLTHEPNDSGGSSLSGNPTASFRVIFSEGVNFKENDVTIVNGNEDPVAVDVSGSGSQFMLIGLGEPLFGDTYTVTIADTVTSAATGSPLDGDKDGFAGGDWGMTITHRCPADTDGNGAIDFQDILAILANWGSCPP